MKNRGTSKSGRRAGFTLLEIMLAMAILSIGAFTLVEATSRCLAALRQSRNYQTARLMLKQGELDHPLVRTNAPDQNKVTETRYDNGFVFSRSLTQYDDEPNLYFVRTRVTWSDRGDTSFEEVESLFYYPPENELLNP